MIVTFNSSKEINHNKILAFMDNIEREKEDYYLKRMYILGYGTTLKQAK